MRRPEATSLSAALAEARRGRTAALRTLLGGPPTSGEGGRLLEAALEIAEARADYELLVVVLERAVAPRLRADALAAVLNLADESRPDFTDLMGGLRNGERALVLGALLEATRLDPDPERRLVRLKRLVRVIPHDSRSLYWPEAEALAGQGGDDAQLALFGFARELPPRARPLTLDTLRRAVTRVRDAFKRAMAFVSLSELTELSERDLREAGVSAERIPDRTLRIMTLARLSQLAGDEPS